MPLMQTRGAKVGVCNICGTPGPLTEDHVPPKGCVRPTAVQLEHVADRLSANTPIRTKANHGVRYRTLCADCNNRLLGARYDRVLIDFVNDVIRVLDSPLSLPTTVMIRTQPHLLVRAIWGHLAAVGVDRYPKGPRTEEFKDFFRDESIPLPTGLNFYYWLYPHRRQVLIRDAGSLDVNGFKKATFWAMKFYPMAFAVWAPIDIYSLPYRDLVDFCRGASRNSVDVPVDLSGVPHELILEAPTETQVIMYGRDAVVANRRPPRGTIIRG